MSAASEYRTVRKRWRKHVFQDHGKGKKGSSNAGSRRDLDEGSILQAQARVWVVVAVLALWEKKQHPAVAHPGWGTVQGCVWVLAGNDINSRTDQCQALWKSAPTRAFRGELAGLDNATSKERGTQTRLAEKEHTETGNIWSDGLIACGQNKSSRRGTSPAEASVPGWVRAPGTWTMLVAGKHQVNQV